jgi:hypothetical protein
MFDFVAKLMIGIVPSACLIPLSPLLAGFMGIFSIILAILGSRGSDA